MKNIKIITMVTIWLIVLFVFVSCKDVANSEDEVYSEGVVINGTLSDYSSRTLKNVDTVQSKSTEGIIERVILLYESFFVEKTITDGSFSVPTNSYTPAGLVFVGEGDSFEGYVSFGEQLNTIPLQATENKNQEINLGQLNIDSTDAQKYLPEYDPMDYMNTTEQELNSLATFGSLFSSVITNPDFDNNGVIDILEKKWIMPKVLFYLNNTATFNNKLTPDITQGDISIGSHKYLISLRYPETFQEENVSLTYPDTTSVFGVSGLKSYDNNTYSIFMGGTDGAISGIPPAGDYTFSIESMSYSFYFPSAETEIDNNIVIFVPTVTLNSDETLVESVSWECYQGDMTPINNPGAIIDKLELQIDGTQGRIYDSGWLPIKPTEHVLEKEISTNDVTSIMFAYDDHYGNHYVIGYDKE